MSDTLRNIIQLRFVFMTGKPVRKRRLQCMHIGSGFYMTDGIRFCKMTGPVLSSKTKVTD